MEREKEEDIWRRELFRGAYFGPRGAPLGPKYAPLNNSLLQISSSFSLSILLLLHKRIFSSFLSLFFFASAKHIFPFLKYFPPIPSPFSSALQMNYKTDQRFTCRPIFAIWSRLISNIMESTFL